MSEQPPPAQTVLLRLPVRLEIGDLSQECWTKALSDVGAHVVSVRRFPPGQLLMVTNMLTRDQSPARVVAVELEPGSRGHFAIELRLELRNGEWFWGPAYATARRRAGPTRPGGGGPDRS